MIGGHIFTKSKIGDLERKASINKMVFDLNHKLGLFSSGCDDILGISSNYCFYFGFLASAVFCCCFFQDPYQFFFFN